MATALIDHYRPLVEIMVLSPTGQLVARRSMNEDIMDHFPHAETPDEALVNYFVKFLADAGRASRILGDSPQPGGAKPAP